MSPANLDLSYAGAGSPVVCIRAEASGSSPWRSLAGRVPAARRVIAADLLGVGRSPARPVDRLATLRDEVDRLEPVFAGTTGRLFLVGHSYGAAVALLAALAHPQRVLGLALYEPTLFALLDQATPGQPEANGIRCTSADADAAIERGDPAAAAELCIDYWMGPGAWRCMPSARRESLTAFSCTAAGQTRTLLMDETPLDAFRTLALPVLCMTGTLSPASARAVTRLLAGVLPNVTITEFDALGHLGPTTHPDLVDGTVTTFLDRCESSDGHTTHALQP